MSAKEEADHSYFHASTRLRVSDIHEVLGAPHRTLPKKALCAVSLGPGINLTVSAGLCRDGITSVILGEVECQTALSRPFTARFTFTASSYAGVVYRIRSFVCTFKERGSRGSESVLTADYWESKESLRVDDGFVLHVDAVSPPARRFTAAFPEVLSVVHSTLRRTVPSTDIRFVAFKRRNRSGRLSQREELHSTQDMIAASGGRLGHILASPTDDDVLRFGEAVNKRRVTDYADPDSDFEGDDEDEDGNGEENQDEDGGLNGDTTLGSDMESDVEVKTDSTGDGHPMDFMDDGKSIMQIDPEEDAGAESAAITVIGASSITWEALLYYFCTGMIEFAPLRSSGIEKREAAVKAYSESNPSRPPLCSPKSMYRLAQKYSLQELQEICLNNIGSQMDCKNVLLELLTPFTVANDAVKQVELRYLDEHLRQVKNAPGFSALILEIASGKYPNGGQLLLALMGRG